jgi:hypothetical protein
VSSVAFSQRELEQALAEIGVGIEYRTDNAGRRVARLYNGLMVSEATYCEAGL